MGKNNGFASLKNIFTSEVKKGVKVGVEMGVEEDISNNLRYFPRLKADYFLLLRQAQDKKQSSLYSLFYFLL